MKIFQYAIPKFMMLRYQSVTCMLWIIMLSRDWYIHDVGHTCPDPNRRCVDSCVEMKLSNRAYNQDYHFIKKSSKTFFSTFLHKSFLLISWSDVYSFSLRFWPKTRMLVKYMVLKLKCPSWKWTVKLMRSRLKIYGRIFVYGPFTFKKDRILYKLLENITSMNWCVGVKRFFA